MEMTPRRWKAAVGPGAQEAATWLFALSFLTLGVGRDHAYVEWAGLALLAFASFVLFRQPVPVRAIPRITLSAAVLVLVVCAYLVFGSWPSSFGTGHSYDVQAVYFVLTYLAVCVFAVLFFDERVFERVIWRAAIVALWIGVLSWLVSRLTHHLVLVSTSHGVLRMQGMLSEPSAWAPVISLVVLLALRRRSWWALGLAALATVLTASPTCVLALAASVPLYYVLTGTRRSRVVVVLALAVSLPAAVLFVYTAGSSPYLNSHNTAEKAVGRLLAGIEYAKTDGRAGHNTRLADTRVVVSAAKANGSILAGAGPAADETYFPARFPSGTLRPNALWVSVLFDFGLMGVLLLGALMVVAVWRMRGRPQMCAILLPFFVASLINSAEGNFEYGFVALGIMLFTFGWAGTGQARDPSPAARPDRPAVLEAGRTQA
jgi:hypothetical protein